VTSDRSTGKVPVPSDHHAAGQEALDLAWLLAGELRTRWVTKAAGVGLSVGQAEVLKNLSASRPVSMRVLARLSGLDPSNLTAIADKLEARGLVERRASQQDRRAKELVITDAGHSTLDALRSALDADLGPLSPLSADQVTLLRDLLRQVVRARHQG
jgi:MarR family transcriptional regulator, organic hydroperoxide resistance regulator